VRYFTTEPVITFEAAQHVLGAAAEHAGSLGVPVCVAVADRAGHLVAFGRIDGAPLLLAQIAQDKAYSVAAFGGVPTHEWWTMIADEPPLLHGIVKTDRLIVFGGGVPVRADGALIGAVGVSGGSAQQDQAVAEAGAAALEV
jgi:glc operon protein GlcG